MQVLVAAMSRTSSADRVAFWRRLIARQASSCVTVGELCRRAGVSTASFYAWRRRLKARDVVSKQSSRGKRSLLVKQSSLGKRSSLVPVRVVADHGAEITVELVNAAPQTSLTPLPTIRVSIPSGCDEASIRRVLCAALSARTGGRTAC